MIQSLLLAAEAPLPMVEKLRYLVPEVVLFGATVVVMVMALSKTFAVRKLTGPVAALALLAAGVASAFVPASPASLLPNLMPFAKSVICMIGLLLCLLMTGTVDREYEESIARGVSGGFDPIRSNRGEFYSFFLFSLTGLLLTCSADDLIWIFLALELTSLPTYVMVAISARRSRAQEAGIKYFFLGAFGAATFLFGFALLYGATGTTTLFGTAAAPGIAQILSAQSAASQGHISTIAMLGMVMSIIGVSFKIAAAPMHFYTPDVYEGAASPVSAFLAFVPKAAGIITITLLLSAVGWGYGPAGTGLPDPIRVTLWVMAAMTMTVGNVMAILQSSVKRMLAYSSIAHSGYMLVGLIAGPGVDAPDDPARHGVAATLFYLFCYGFMNLGCFAVLACVEKPARDGRMEEIETVDDLRGLCGTHPVLGWTMVLCAASLLGLPPLLGFVGKFYLFTSAISAGEIPLVIVMGLNSAIAAFYYLRLAGAPLLEPRDHRDDRLHACPFQARAVAAVLSAASVIVLVLPSGAIIRRTVEAMKYTEPRPAWIMSGGPGSVPGPPEASSLLRE